MQDPFITVQQNHTKTNKRKQTTLTRIHTRIKGIQFDKSKFYLFFCESSVCVFVFVF